MATVTINLNPNQTKALKDIVAGGKIAVGSDIDGRTARSLENKGLVKVATTKAGIFVTPTAKGKKFLN